LSGRLAKGWSVKRILIVDDNPAVRKLVTEILRERYLLTEAQDGAEALASIQREPPDAVILDMMMPVMNGWTFLLKHAALPVALRMPVIVVSGEPSACEDGMRLGAQACLPKPFDVDSLLATIEQACHYYQAW
jgi:CheY-like chemotaxis protein